jgi:hypothetical protein
LKMSQIESNSSVRAELESGKNWLRGLYKKLVKTAKGEKHQHIEEDSKKSPILLGKSDRVPAAGEAIDVQKTLLTQVKAEQPVVAIQQTVVEVIPGTAVTAVAPVEATIANDTTEIGPEEAASVAVVAFTFPPGYGVVEPLEDQSKNTLVIKNLPFKFKPTDLEQLLNDYNTKPKNVRLLRDDAGRFTGMAFIRCPSKEEAQRLICSMNDLDIGGRNIQVEFKMKKKKRSGSSSLSSSTDELPAPRSLRASNNGEPESLFKVPEAQQATIQPQSTTATKGPRKLAASAENHFGNNQLRRPLQLRRKSTSVVDSDVATYAHSAVPKLHPSLAQGPSVRPVRQPIGPDGKTNGFSTDYRKSRTVVPTQ